VSTMTLNLSNEFFKLNFHFDLRLCGTDVYCSDCIWNWFNRGEEFYQRLSLIIYCLSDQFCYGNIFIMYILIVLAICKETNSIFCVRFINRCNFCLFSILCFLLLLFLFKMFVSFYFLKVFTNPLACIATALSNAYIFITCYGCHKNPSVHCFECLSEVRERERKSIIGQKLITPTKNTGGDWLEIQYAYQNAGG
jgi:hypothetical protein